MKGTVLALALLGMACTPRAAAPPAAAASPAPGAATGAGQDKEHPVPVCGTRESYAYVAGTFQCPEGGNPLGGDLQAGHDARQGNVGPHDDPDASTTDYTESHIVDVYSVPCRSGAQQIYVCMYHCPPGRSGLD